VEADLRTQRNAFTDGEVFLEGIRRIYKMYEIED